MRRGTFAVALLATFIACIEPGRADDQLKIAVGGRGIGETFVTEVGYKAGLFKPHNLALDIFYPEGRRFNPLRNANKINGFCPKARAGPGSHDCQVHIGAHKQREQRNCRPQGG